MLKILFLLILGYTLYNVFKSYSRYENAAKKDFENFSTSYESIKESELGLFVALVAKVAKADGRVDNLEAQLIGIMFDDISATFPNPQATKDILKQIFKEEKQNLDNVLHVAQKLALKTKHQKQTHQQFMGFLIQLAFVDGECSKAEERILAQIAEALEFDPKIYHAIFDKFESMMQNIQPKASLDDAYALLGVSKDDDMETIKKAYRKLIRKYHPDIIKSKTKDESYIQEATKKTQEINQAYEMIKKARG